MSEKLDTLTELADKMHPQFEKWTDEYGAPMVVKVLAVYISEMASQQPIPLAAIHEFCKLLRKVHAG